MKQLSSHCWYDESNAVVLGVASFDSDRVYHAVKQFSDNEKLTANTDLVLLQAEEGNLSNMLTNLLLETLKIGDTKFRNVYAINDSANLHTIIHQFNKNNYTNVLHGGSTEFNLLCRSFDYHCNRFYRKINVMPERHFVNLNGVPKYFRARIVDDLMNNRLLRYTFWSWNKRNFTSDMNIRFDNLKQFDPNIEKNIDASGVTLATGEDSQEKLPMEYQLALIDIFAESIPDNFGEIFITEKTWKPLLGEKPFLGFNERHYYKTLQSYGIRLYETLFDYSFDEIEDPEERYLGYIENIIRLGNMPLEDVHTLVLAEEENLRLNRITLENLNPQLPEKLQPFADSLDQQSRHHTLKLWYDTKF